MENSYFHKSASDRGQLPARIGWRAGHDRPPDMVCLNALPDDTDATSGLNRESILLDTVGGHALLTTVEDSLETILDILREMRSLAIAGCHCEVPPVAVSQNADSHCIGIGTTQGTDSDLATTLDACKYERLRGLRRELRELMENTRFERIPLLDAASPPPPIFIDMAPNTALRVELEAPGSALLSVASTQIATPAADLLARAIADVTESVDRVAGRRSRLKMVIHDQSLPTRRHGGDCADISDANSLRAQLTMVGRRIADDAVEAFLAQASAERRLVDFLYRHGSSNALTRIYTIAGDHDRDAGAGRGGRK